MGRVTGNDSRQPADDKALSQAMAAALRLLSYRARSRQEVQQRLASRFPADVVQQTLERLAEQGLIDDAAFARLWRQSRQGARPRSAFLLVRELVAKGVDREVAEAAMEGLDDQEAAYQAGRHHLRLLHGQDQVIFRRRLGAYLARRGFAFGVVRHVVEHLWHERELF